MAKQFKTSKRDWLRYLKTSVSEKTIFDYQRLFEGYFEPFLLNTKKRYTEIEPKDLIKLRQTLLGSHKSVNTINLILTSISSFYNYLFEQGLIMMNPAALRGLRAKNGRNNAAKRIKQRYIDRERFSAILKATQSPDMRKAIELMTYAGLRVSEVARLEKSHFEENGSGILWVNVYDSKGNGFRKSALIDNIEEVKEWLNSLDREKLFLFSIHAIKQHCQNLSKRLGFRFSAHDFRHTFAINALNKGLSLEDLKALLGHSSITVTEIYGKISGIKLEKALARILER